MLIVIEGGNVQHVLSTGQIELFLIDRDNFALMKEKGKSLDDLKETIRYRVTPSTSVNIMKCIDEALAQYQPMKQASSSTLICPKCGGKVIGITFRYLSNAGALFCYKCDADMVFDVEEA